MVGGLLCWRFICLVVDTRESCVEICVGDSKTGAR